eukprot:2484895-Alexandrium_andersonii.AAC.1
MPKILELASMRKGASGRASAPLLSSGIMDAAKPGWKRNKAECTSHHLAAFHSGITCAHGT